MASPHTGNPDIVPVDNLKKQGLYFDHPRPQLQSEHIQAADVDQGLASRPPSPPNIRPRTAQACDKCRERKTKCSGEKPTCTRCSNRGLICHYSIRANRSKGQHTPSARREQRRASRESDSVSHSKASSPGMSQQLSRTNTPNVFNKPYPCPPISRYSAGSNGAYTNNPLPVRSSHPEFESYRSPQPIVPGSGSPFISNSPHTGYDCRQSQNSFVEGVQSAYIDRARNQQDSLPGNNVHLWHSPYMTASMGRQGDHRLASGPADREPCLSRASNSSSSDESLVGTPAHSVAGPSDFYYRGGASATGSPRESVSIAPSVSGYVNSHLHAGSFLDFANSFASSHPSPVTEWPSPEVSPPTRFPPQDHLELAYPPVDNNRCYQYSYT